MYVHYSYLIPYRVTYTFEDIATILELQSLEITFPHVANCKIYCYLLMFETIIHIIAN